MILKQKHSRRKNCDTEDLRCLTEISQIHGHNSIGTTIDRNIQNHVVIGVRRQRPVPNSHVNRRRDRLDCLNHCFHFVPRSLRRLKMFRTQSDISILANQLKVEKQLQLAAENQANNLCGGAAAGA